MLGKTTASSISVSNRAEAEACFVSSAVSPPEPYYTRSARSIMPTFRSDINNNELQKTSLVVVHIMLMANNECRTC
jgi:hypothetical protein